MHPLTIEEFNKAHKLYYAPLLGLGFSMLKDYAKAEDFVQEAFIRLWEARATSSMQSAKSYLFLGLTNRIKNEFRHLKIVKKHDELCQDQDQLEYNVLQQESIQYEMYSLLYEAIENLSQRRKDVVLACLKMDKDKSRAEIADSLKMSLSTLKEQRKKAYEFIRMYVLPRFKNI